MLATAEEGYPLSTPAARAGRSRTPTTGGARRRPCSSGSRAGPIGFSGQMHGLVTLDAEQRVLRPAILWNDQRTAAECAEIEERVGLERLIALTGNRALTGFTAPKLLWLRTHEPEAYERIAHILLPKDYVRLRLEGELAIDAADASGTLLFDVANRRWSDEVLDALDIPHAWLPRVYESTGERRRGRPGCGRARCRHRRARPALDRPRHVGRRLRRAARVRRRRPGAPAHVLPCGAGDVARDGRDALGCRLAALAARRRRRRLSATARRTPSAGPPGPKACSSSRT